MSFATENKIYTSATYESKGSASETNALKNMELLVDKQKEKLHISCMHRSHFVRVFLCQNVVKIN